MANDFFSRLMKIESGGDPNAKSKTSSATGLFQMTRGTFDDLKSKDKSLANYTWEDHARDPAIQRKFAEKLLSRNDKLLNKSGHEVNDLNRYLAHFAGPTGADKVLRADPNLTIESVLGKNVAKANNMFGTTVGQMKDFFAKKLGIPQQKPQQSPYPVIDYSKVSASASPPKGALGQMATAAPSSLSVIPTAMAISRGQQPQMAKKGGKIRKHESYKNPIPKDSLLNMPPIPPKTPPVAPSKPASPAPMGAMAQPAPMPMARPQQLPPEVQSAQLGQIQAQKQGMYNQPPQAPMPMPTGAPASLPQAGIPQNTTMASAPQPQAPMMAHGGVVRFAEGESVGNPWDDYKSAPSNAPKATAPAGDTPWSDYAPAPAKGKKVDSQQTKDQLRDIKRGALGLGQGIIDPFVAIGQMLPSKTINDLADRQLNAYAEKRKELGGEGFDWGRLGGNVVTSAIPVGAASKLGQAGQLLKNSKAGLFKRGATSGAVAGATQPVLSEEGSAPTEDQSFWTEKGLQTGTGALFGGAINKLLGRKTPEMLAQQSKVDEYRQMFPKANMTWGQNLGGRWNDLEQKMTSMPFVGDVIKDARNKAFENQNVGMMNKALESAGLKLDKGTKAGRGMFDEAYNKLSDQYTKLLDDAHLPNPQDLRARIFGKMDTGTGKSLATADQLADSYKPGVISNKYNQLSEEGQKKFDRLIENGLFKKFGKDPQGNHSLSMSGKQFKQHEEDLKDTIDSLMHGGGEDREIGKMLKTSLGEVYDSLQSAKPEVANKLKSLNKSYAQYKTLETASTAAGASEGLFTPAQTIRAATKGNRGQVARGKGLMQKEAELSQDVLGKPYPDSGTAGRLQSGNLFRNLVGGAASLPLEIMYSPAVSSAVLQGGSRAKNAFQGTRLGSKLADKAPIGVPSAVRALLSPSGSSPEEEIDVPMAQGGLVRQYDSGGMVDAVVTPESMVGMDSPYGPTLPQLWDRYTSYLDNNIRNAQQDLENSIVYDKEKGLHIKDKEAFKRTMDNMNPAGTFIGPASKLWNKVAGDKFLAEEGKATLKELWKKYGTGRDPSGALKQEIDDSMARLNASALTRNTKNANEVFEHPELFKHYPELEKAQLGLLNSRNSGGQAYESIDRLTGRRTPHIDINRAYYSKSGDKGQAAMDKTALHEFQHLIQRMEGTAQGGSPGVEGAQMAKKLGITAPKETAMHRDFLQSMLETAKKEGHAPSTIADLERRIKDANKPVVNDTAKRKAYQRLLGEAESRLTEARSKLNPQQRLENYPFTHGEHAYGYDVPVNELITGGYRGLPEMASYAGKPLARGGLARFRNYRV